MRIATLILGLVLGLLLVIAGFIDLMGNAIIMQMATGEIPAEMDPAAEAFWILLFAWVIGLALVLIFPFVSVIAFGIASFAGVSMAGPVTFIALWGVCSMVLTVTSFFGWIGKRQASKAKKLRRREDRERKKRIEALEHQLAQQGEQQA